MDSSPIVKEMQTNQTSFEYFVNNKDQIWAAMFEESGFYEELLKECINDKEGDFQHIEEEDIKLAIVALSAAFTLDALEEMWDVSIVTGVKVVCWLFTTMSSLGELKREALHSIKANVLLGIVGANYPSCPEKGVDVICETMEVDDNLREFIKELSPKIKEVIH